MEGAYETYEALVRSAAKRLRGHQRRLFQAEVAAALCQGNARQAEARFGWGRETVQKGLHELHQGIRCLENFAGRARPRWEEKHPQLATAIRAIVEPHTQADPELKSARRYTNLSAKEVCAAWRAQGYAEADLPKERTMRNILNRLNYRLQRIQKAKPLKKTKETDVIFANVAAAKQEAQEDPTSLEISMDTKAKVNEGDYVRGGKTRTHANGDTPKGWDHDPPAQRKWTPLGILMVATGALTVFFGSKETSDFWGDALMQWWRQVRGGLGHIKRLVIYLDNGPNNSGRRRQFLKRLIEFADWSGLEIRLVYYPPYHSKYNPIERCWSALERKWNGALLNGLKVILQHALRMTWCGQHPTVKRLAGPYVAGATISNQEWKHYEARLERSKVLPKYDIVIKPKDRGRQVN
jgi:hypothetical protein